VRQQPGVPNSGAVLPQSIAGPRHPRGSGQNTSSAPAGGATGAGGYNVNGQQRGPHRGGGHGQTTVRNTATNPFSYAGFSAANPPAMTAAQLAAKQAVATSLSQNAMQQIQNPTVRPGTWEGAIPGSPLRQQIDAAMAQINAQRQAQAAGGSWTAASWLDLPPNLRPPGLALGA